MNGYQPVETSYPNVNWLYLGSPTGPVQNSQLAHGRISAIADFNKDGYGDIATGNGADPSEDSSSNKGGEVNIAYGSDSGTSGAEFTLTQDTAGVSGTGETTDRFGHEVATGDVDADGNVDLTIGAPGEDIGSAIDTGSAHVIYGAATSTGLNTSRVQFFHQDTAGVPGSDESGDFFGNDVFLSDIDKDGKEDLSIAADGENNLDGAIWNLRGSATSVTTTGAVRYGPSDFGISTSGEPAFGANFAG